ncbi:MAG: hypothetical protein NC337_15745 [Roseburia sp.]|nr:hypothetical protein [Roseburia sp.]
MPKQLAEKPERLSALNALLNMDEKGDNALGMDDAPEEGKDDQETSRHDARESEKPETEEKTSNEPIQYPTANSSTHGFRLAAGMADKPMQKASLKEKPEAFKIKAA